MIRLPEKCLRDRTDCRPLAQVASDSGNSFICCGCNDETNRVWPEDRFRMCWVNESVDEMTDWDERDLKDTISVMAQALSADENMKVNEKQKAGERC